MIASRADALRLVHLAETLNEAARRLPMQPRFYRIAGQSVRMNVGARGGAARVLEALGPLARDECPDQPALELFVWDGAGDGFVPPLDLVAERAGAAAGALGAFDGANVRAFFQPDAGVLSVFDAAGARAHCWWRDVSRLPYYEHAAPLRHLLQWWMLSRGGALLHSAAVGTPAGGFLIVGPSGSGKSTTALACCEAGMGFASDDYVLVDGEDPPSVHMAYSTAKVVRESLPGHARYGAYFRNIGRENEKPMMFLHEAMPGQMLESFPLCALVLPVLSRQDRTRIVPAAPAELLRALAPSSVVLFPLAGAAAFGRIAHLCRTLPCFRAELSADPRELALALAAWMRGADLFDLVPLASCA